MKEPKQISDALCGRKFAQFRHIFIHETRPVIFIQKTHLNVERRLIGASHTFWLNKV